MIMYSYKAIELVHACGECYEYVSEYTILQLRVAHLLRPDVYPHCISAW